MIQYRMIPHTVSSSVETKQNELSALREIVRASDLPSFSTNVTNCREAAPQDKVAVPLSDPEVNVQFWCICLAEKQAEYAPLFEAIKKRCE